MPLDPKQLDAFAAAVETTSLAAAARQLHITLAAVSLRIKALETQLGQRLLVRGKSAQATRAGQLLLAHIRRRQLLEAELLHNLQSDADTPAQWQTLHVAVNADSMASWFLQGVQSLLQSQRLLLQCVVDDQEHTLQWLKNGDVIGCVTQLEKPLRGCAVQPLGVMRYRCVASPQVAQQLKTIKRRTQTPALLHIPAICFNAKDNLQERFVQEHFKLHDATYPRHYVQANDAYHLALLQGLGWGMQADVQLRFQWHKDWAAGKLVDLFPGRYVDVPLLWHHWQQESEQATRLTQAVVGAARKALLQPNQLRRTKAPKATHSAA
jgi:LysR family transcriptional regulator, chromosome initiation inhibitor